MNSSEHAAAPIDTHAFRAALGAFATGVTIVTTSHQHRDFGLTVNSFNSVSLDPPMVLWSLGKRSYNLEHFRAADHFAIHVLAEDQENLSTRFATRGDKFFGLQIRRGEGEVPILAGCVAAFQCRKLFEYEGGDHTIFVGEVLQFSHVAKQPLLYHAGKYAIASQRGNAEAKSLDLSDGLAFLFARAYFSLLATGIQQAEREGISWADRYVLGVLLDRGGRSIAELNAMIGYSGLRTSAEAVQDLIDRGFVIQAANERGTQILWLSAEGRQSYLSMIAGIKAREAQAEIHLGNRTDELKVLLARLAAILGQQADVRLDRNMQIKRNIINVP